jgi:hypothetical protein
MGQEAYYDERRRQRLWSELNQIRQGWIEQPPVLVEVPEESVLKIEMRDLEGLPGGVELSPGSITVRFSNPEEALQKLMALALAISRNREAFEQRIRLPGSATGLTV